MKLISKLMSYVKTCILIVIINVLFTSLLFAQNVDFDAPDTSDSIILDTSINENDNKSLFDFYQGINLYNTGYVAESLLAFQRSISLKNEPLYQYMYARTSRAYGLEEQTEYIFESLFNSGYLQNYIRAKLEFLRIKNKLQENSSLKQFVRSSSIDFSKYGYVLPITIRTLPDGNIAIVFLQSEDIIIVSPTGELLFELSTNVLPIQRPFDVIYTINDKFLVTSFSADKIYEFNKDGSSGKSFFIYDKNRSEYPVDMLNYFSGPQYMTEGDSSSIYVTTYGSSRVFKFSKEGEYLFNFGSQSSIFQGLNQPTGIVYAQNRIIIADYLSMAGQSYSRLYTFDISGNFLKYVNISNERIESIRRISERLILISTETHIYKFDINTDKIVEEFTQNEFQRIMSATFDNNEVLWIVDQDRGRVETFNTLENQYSGIDTYISKIDSTNFPEIEMRIKVRNSSGLPLSGLSANNFVLFENNQTINTLKVQPIDLIQEKNNMIIIIPSISTFNTENQRGKMQESIASIAKQGEEMSLNSTKKVIFSVLDVKQVPRYSVKDTIYSKEVINVLDNYHPNIKNEQFLLESIRYAINTLLPISYSKKTILIAGGLPKIQDSQQMKVWSQLEKILDYYQIGLVWVSADIEEATPNYFQSIIESNKSLSLHTNFLDPNILKEIVNFNENGTYLLHYSSKVKKEFNEKFIPLEIEANYFAGSGKDIFGYVAPNWDQN